MAGTEEMPLDATALVQSRMSQAIQQARTIDLLAYARRRAVQQRSRFTADFVDKCRLVYDTGRKLGQGYGEHADPTQLQRSLLDFLHTEAAPFEHLFVAGLMSKLPVNAVIRYRDIYDDEVSSPAFPPAARDLTQRTSPVHPSTIQAKEPDLAGYTNTQLATFAGSRSRSSGIPVSEQPRPTHVARLLLPMTNRKADLEVQASQVQGFMAARDEAGEKTLAIATQLPAHLEPVANTMILAQEAAAGALYLGTETPGESQLPPLHTLVVADPPKPRRPLLERDGSSEDPRDWLAALVRGNAVPVDAVAICGGDVERRDLAEWQLPKQLPLLDYRGTEPADLPLREIEQRLSEARAAVLRNPRVRRRYLSQFDEPRHRRGFRR